MEDIIQPMDGSSRREQTLMQHASISKNFGEHPAHTMHLPDSPFPQCLRLHKKALVHARGWLLQLRRLLQATGWHWSHKWQLGISSSNPYAREQFLSSYPLAFPKVRNRL